MDHVDFPIDAVLSVVATLANGDTVEVGTVGREGFVEADAALELADRAAQLVLPGRRAGRRACRSDRFQRRMATSAPFARLMRHNVSATLFSAQQFAACNSKHPVIQRCARWLLMTADRVGDTRFELTHDFLAIMLGVRRAGVSEAAEALHRLGAIEYHRGTVTIVDLGALRAASVRVLRRLPRRRSRRRCAERFAAASARPRRARRRARAAAGSTRRPLRAGAAGAGS